MTFPNPAFLFTVAVLSAITGWLLTLRYGRLTVARAECIIRFQDWLEVPPERLAAARQCLAEAFEQLLVECETKRDEMLHACYREDPRPSLLMRQVANWLEQHPDLVVDVGQRDRGYLVLARWNTNWGYFMSAEECLDKLSHDSPDRESARRSLQRAELSSRPKKPDCAHVIQL